VLIPFAPALRERLRGYASAASGEALRTRDDRSLGAPDLYARGDQKLPVRARHTEAGVTGRTSGAELDALQHTRAG
jgi:hypothetical protein